MIYFQQTAERLLAEQFVCEISDAAAFRFLHQDEQRDAMNEWLGKIGRRVACNAGGNVYYLACNEISDQNRETTIGLFAHLQGQLLPVTEFLQLVFNARRDESILHAGSLISPGELLTAIESAKPLQERLGRITGSGLFKSAASTADVQLRTLLAKLEQHGYLVSLGLQYRVTGKVDYALEVLDLIRETQGLPFEESAGEVQQELF